MISSLKIPRSTRGSWPAIPGEHLGHHVQLNLCGGNLLRTGRLGRPAESKEGHLDGVCVRVGGLEEMEVLDSCLRCTGTFGGCFVETLLWLIPKIQRVRAVIVCGGCVASENAWRLNQGSKKKVQTGNFFPASVLPPVNIL